MNLEECREWIRQHQADSDDDAARALLSLLASKTDREERAKLRAIVGAAIRWKWAKIGADQDWQADEYDTALADAVTDYEVVRPREG